MNLTIKELTVNKILLYDFSNILYSTYFNMLKEQQLITNEDKNDYWRYLIIKDLVEIKKKFNPKEFILAIDSKSNWRKDYFKYYKARRVFAKEKSPIDWDNFYKVSNSIIEDIKLHYPCKTIQVEKAEADDVIATIALKLKDNNEIIVATRDKDFKQLLIYPNIKIFDLSTREMLTEDDPYLFRLIHLLKGDSGDDVPNLLSDDNVFVNSDKRQKRITQKVISEYLELGCKKFVIKHGVVDNYNRNCKLILLDLDNIPVDIQEETMYQYHNNNNDATFESLLELVRKYNMYGLLEDI